MAEHLSDEEQLEAIKRWWKKNGTALLLALVVGAGGWFGWNYWQDNRAQKAENASVVYMAMLDALDKWETEDSDDAASTIAAHAETLKELGEGTFYGVYGALTIARLAVVDGDLETAAAELRWARDHTGGSEALDALVKLRLAAVEYSRANTEQALVLLEEPYPDAYTALYQELRGDILAARGDNELALEAYRTALENLDETGARARAMLELKMNQLASATDDGVAAGKEDS